MSLENKLKDSKFSLEGNGFNPTPTIPSWGFENPNITAPTLNPLDPKLSALQYTYSVDTNPAKVKIVSFNKTQYKPYLPTESKLDELDVRAPKNTRAGLVGSVVSQIYKSSTNQNYKDKGPKNGRYVSN
jgi:hypothetical protein